jgi:hypothetical protein
VLLNQEYLRGSPDKLLAGAKRRQLEVLRSMIRLSEAMLKDIGRIPDPSHSEGVTAYSFRQTVEFADAVDVLSGLNRDAAAAAAARSSLEGAAQTAYLANEPHSVRIAAYLAAPLLIERRSLTRQLSEATTAEDRAITTHMLRRCDEELAYQRQDTSGRLAIDELERQKGPIIWHATAGGHRTVHQILHQIGRDDLSAVYTDLNASVHATPKHALSAVIRTDSWLPPLRQRSALASPSLRATALALHLAMTEVAKVFVRCPGCSDRLQRAAAAHNRAANAVHWPVEFL